MSLGMKLSGLALSLSFAGAAVAQVTTAEIKIQAGELATQCSAFFSVLAVEADKKHKADPKKNPKDGSQYSPMIANFDTYAGSRLTPERRTEVFYGYTAELMRLDVLQERAINTGDADLLNRVHARQNGDLHSCNRMYMQFVMPELAKK